MRQRISGIAVMRLAAHERDRAGDAVAFAAPDHGLAGGGGPQIIDAQIERRVRCEGAELAPHRDAGRHIHQRQDRPRGEHAEAGSPDQRRGIGEYQLGPVVAMRAVADPQLIPWPAKRALKNKRGSKPWVGGTFIAGHAPAPNCACCIAQPGTLHRCNVSRRGGAASFAGGRLKRISWP